MAFDQQAGRWWLAEEGMVAAALAGVATTLESYDTERRARNLIFARQSTGRDLPNIYGLSLSRTFTRPINFSEWTAPVFNVTGSSVETLVNKVGRNKPWILFQTDRANFAGRRAGKKKSRFIDGVFHETNTYRLTRQMVQDGLSYGNGFIKASLGLDGKSIVHDVVLPDELLIDPWDALYFGKWPRSLIHRTFVSRGELMAVFGDTKETQYAIENAPGAHQGPMWTGPSTSASTAMVAVLEGWKLPEPDGAPGRHVLCIADRIALVDEKYKRFRFPFAKFTCIPAGRGFWDIGIPEILAPFQANINRTQQVIDACQRRMSTGRWTVSNQSGVTVDALGSAPAGVIFHNPGQAPQWIAPGAIAPEIYQHLEATITRAYKRAGISELAAQAMKPGGLNSGEALRAFQSAESERYVTLGMALEEAVVDLAKIDLEIAEEAKPRVRAPRPGGIDVIDWRQLDKLDDKDANMIAFPISSLPTSPAGRLQRAAEMFQKGQISKEDELRLIDYPDTGAVIDIQTASRDCIDWMLDKIVFEGVFESPEEYMNLDPTSPSNVITIAQNRYLRERTEAAPEDRLELLRRFMAAAKELQERIFKEQQAPAASAGIPGAAGPVGMSDTQATASGLPPPLPPIIGAPATLPRAA